MTPGFFRISLTCQLLIGACLLPGAGWVSGAALADEPGPNWPAAAAPPAPAVPLAREVLSPTPRIGPAVRPTASQADGQARLLQQVLQEGDRILPPGWADLGYVSGYWLAQTLIHQGEDLLLHLEQPVAAGAALGVYRPGVTLTDPVTGEEMGILAHHLGQVQVTGGRVETAWQARLVAVRDTVAVGDRLWPDQEITTDLHRHTQVPAPVRGRVLSLPDGMELAGADQVVAVGVGRRDRVSPGLVLTIQHTAAPGLDPVTGQEVQDAPHVIGEATLFWIGEKASFALLGPTSYPVSRGDEVSAR
ncbi:MAG: hypothetical protein HQL87_06660 [Magnetococcales bacterium]|nr:hypothetical protein [Magnetococcales bacterium]